MAATLDLAASDDVATPRGAPRGLVAKVLADQAASAFVARAGAWLAGWWNGPFKLGGKVLVVRHADVTAALARDLQYRIGPVNAERIGAVNGGAFVLGMDRGATLTRERAALYRALHRVDLDAIRARLETAVAQRVAAAGAEIDVVGGFARPLAAATATALFGVSGPDPETFVDVVRAVFAHTFLNLGGDATVRDRALRASALMRAWLAVEIAARRASGDLGHDMMGALLADPALDDLTVQRTLGGMLVGSIDTTASSVARVVAMLGRNPALAAGIAADLDDPERVAGWCWEALRLWPHNPILLREAAEAGDLAGVPIAPGDKVILWIHAAMLDPSVFPDPRRLDPSRPAGSYLHFGGGLHPCAGRAVNDFQIPILVAALVRRGIASVGPVTWAGSFPDSLTVRFGR